MDAGFNERLERSPCLSSLRQHIIENVLLEQIGKTLTKRQLSRSARPHTITASGSQEMAVVLVTLFAFQPTAPPPLRLLLSLQNPLLLLWHLGTAGTLQRGRSCWTRLQ